MQQLINNMQAEKKKKRERDKTFTDIVFNLLSMVKLATELHRGFRLSSVGLHLSQVKATLCLQSGHQYKV